MSARILIVDDNPTNLKLAADVLEFAGHTVQRAKDAESAMNMIRAEPPDLVLLDIQLPIMDGLTLTRLIKADPATSEVRVVALTAFAMEADQKRALDAGCDGYIAKPIDVEIFPEQVANYLPENPQTDMTR